MKFEKPCYVALLAIVTQSVATGVAAQTADQTAESPSSGLEEILVTATRRTDTLNRVPLSITAASQESLDQQGIKVADDLIRLTPALTIRRGIDSSSTIAVRGIISTAGSQTTGVYLDDTPLQKRTSLGAANGNGSPTPYLFDLERVEVLRGPQGTLYGGSSLGGTIRFITPTPSLEEYSVYSRLEQAFTKGGDPSHEVGVAVGGPIVEGKLGFRVSAYETQLGGYVDRVNVYTGAHTEKNTNQEDGRAVRLSFLWEPTERFRVMPQVYYSYQQIDDASFYFEDVPQYTIGPITTANGANGFPPFTYPAHTYGPIKAGPFTNFLLNPYGRSNEMAIPVLNLEYEFDSFTVKSITSFMNERSKGHKEGGFDNPGNQLGGTGLVSELPEHSQDFRFQFDRDALVQEIRLSSAPSESRWSWVAGLYGQDIDTTSDYKIYEDLDEVARVLRGSSVLALFRAPMLPGGIAGNRFQDFTEKEVAAFGEVTYGFTDKLKGTVGVRVSENEFEFNGYFIGPLVGSNVVSTDTGTQTKGSVKENPVTPKVGLAYQANERNMFYATAAKGYRQGGVNTTAQTPGCTAALAAFGGSPPDTYDSDTVWSYEAGAKMRMFNDSLQLNSSVFWIDWTDIQTNVPLPGCFTFVMNAAEARSAGFDVQAQARLTDSLLMNLTVGYTDAVYTKTLLGPVSAINGSQSLLIKKDDPLAVSPWTVSVGGQYDAQIHGVPVYLRGDYEYNSAYRRTFGPGTTTYGPDVYDGNATDIASIRAGVNMRGVDVSLFVNNLFDSRDPLDRQGGRANCATAECSSYTFNSRMLIDYTFRPRTYGITASYRY